MIVGAGSASRSIVLIAFPVERFRKNCGSLIFRLSKRRSFGT